MVGLGRIDMDGMGVLMENWGDMNGVADMDWGLESGYGWGGGIWVRI